MVTRAESAALTRRALLDAAAELLDLGGPEAVTLREVGARAGVSRGAPYRHFTGKDSLLTAVATESWERIADQVHALRTDPALSASEKQRGALRTLIGVGRDQPHLYQMLFRRPGHRPEDQGEGIGRVRRQLCGQAGGPRNGQTCDATGEQAGGPGEGQAGGPVDGPIGDPAADRMRAAGRFQNEFLAVVAELVGEENARHYGALLLTSAHGIADMELSGHLGAESLRATSDELVDTLVRLVGDAARTA
ncbi:TetR/AcrR family transcriptional regulator [Streptomyces sp. NPDC087440]|uniref:TetR/AcrR family transcriptional regulator n=1 Tax=Streptomyces sp. NPDC087440 TaxID=3365790 RepID=UPI0038084566